MKLSPDVEFHEDIRLLMYRPSGLIHEAALQEVVNILEELKAKLQQPFNRFWIRCKLMKLNSTSRP
jgi:hypothetical protein